MSDNKEEQKQTDKKIDREFIFQLVVVGVLVILLLYNLPVNAGKGVTGNVVKGIGTVSALDILPSGTPEVYGSELGVSFDDVSASNPGLADATMEKLTEYEDMQLTPEQMSRYVKISSSIACEYCCGAKTLVFSNGERACGCAHSYAMRGLAKYLLTKHPDMSDEQILNELGKWKVLFFPGVHEQKAQALKSQGVDYNNYINLASNKYRGAEKGQTSDSGAMVGGC